METYINLGERFRLNKQTKELVDLHTGEIHKDEDEIVLLLKGLKSDKEFNRSMEKAIRDTFGLKTELELYQLKWKSDSWFIKIYRTERREFLKAANLSVNATALLFHIEGYLEYKTNRVANKDGKRFTNKDLQKMVGISPSTLKNALNELEEKFIIKRVGESQQRQIYINPYLMCAGNEMSKDIEKLFTEYKPLTPY